MHIRKTDKPTDENIFLNLFGPKLINKNVFLASDDIEIINKFKKIYDNNLYQFSKIEPKPPTGGIHNIIRQTAEQEEFTTDVIVDLLLLANGKEFYCQPDRYSGFSFVAQNLFLKKDILARMCETKCSREECLFLRHKNLKNNGGTHCCRCCKNLNKHGPACQQEKP